jgi:hypothetical protein
MDSKDHALQFYVHLLNAQLVKEFQISRDLVQQIFGIKHEEDDLPVMVFEIENQQFEIFIITKKLGNIFDHVCVSVENVNGFIRQCREMNLEVSFIPKGEKELVFIKDFVGNLFEIKEK